MELQIERRKYIDASRSGEPEVKVVASIPMDVKSYTDPVLGEIGITRSSFNKKKGVEKIVLISEALRAKGSPMRRIVEFPQDLSKSVSHDITPTDIYVFSRV